jgi:hypothetical protein
MRKADRLLPHPLDDSAKELRLAIIKFMVAEARVSRTHRRPLRTTAGFEDREDHRSLGTSVCSRTMLHVIPSASRMKNNDPE